MKLLLITQKIDLNDDILGVYHEWAREIAKSCEKLSIICLYQGKTDLPDDIQIFSLGKERRRSKAMYTANFYRYIWSLRNDYDTVFVHMNPIYVILGFLFWRLTGKKIFMWYAHPGRNLLVKLAYLLCDKVITSVPEAFYAQSDKVIAIGQGIDTELFSTASTSVREDDSGILYLGRISPAKRVDVLLEAVRLLKAEGVHLSVSVVGDPSETYGGKEYYQKLRDFVADNDLSNTVSFSGSVPNYMTPEVYNRSSILINLSPIGYFDKTVLEAMACERVVIASNEAYMNVFPQEFHGLLIFRQDDARDLSHKIKKALALSRQERGIIGEQLRKIVQEDHSLFTLGKRLQQVICAQ